MAQDANIASSTPGRIANMKIGLLAAALGGLAAAQNLYDRNPHVMELTAKTFKRAVHGTNHTTLVEFYAPWCGYCQKLKPTMERAARALDGLMQVAAVNCDVDANKQLCVKHDVRGYPTLAVFQPAPAKAGARARHVRELYQGQQKLRPLVDFSLGRIRNHVRRLDGDKLRALFDEGGPRPAAVLVSARERVAPLYKSMAIDWLGAVDFAFVAAAKLPKDTPVPDRPGLAPCAEHLAEHLDRSALLLFNPQADECRVYSGELTKPAVAEFLSQAAMPREGPLSKRERFLETLKGKKRTRGPDHDDRDEL
ncbi:FAFR559Cp [Eremothecium gossypii FDAG1]|nr:FAFR559Cp [Eremothecium gossypii FDAG1]